MSLLKIQKKPQNYNSFKVVSSIVLLETKNSVLKTLPINCIKKTNFFAQFRWVRKKQNFFSKLHCFWKGSSGHVEFSSEKKFRELFCQKPLKFHSLDEIDLKNTIISETISSNCSLGHVENIFDKPAEKFALKSRRVFAQNLKTVFEINFQDELFAEPKNCSTQKLRTFQKNLQKIPLAHGTQL